MSATKQINYITGYIDVTTMSQNAHSLAGPALDKLRELYFLPDHKIPVGNLDFGYRLNRTTSYPEIVHSRMFPEVVESQETVAFFTASITCRSSISSFIPDPQSLATHRFDPYMPVAWIREFAHDPWENPYLIVDWVISKVRFYKTKESIKPQEIIWRVPESYLELQRALLSKGFIAESFNQHKKKLSFSLILY